MSLKFMIMDTDKKEKNIKILSRAAKKWTPPKIDDTRSIPTGDMPGDKVEIKKMHKEKADVIFPVLIKKLAEVMESGISKPVVAVHGGSGVGKSETGALLGYYLNMLGIGSYVLSGDNYPRRMPEANDAERKRVFRVEGLKELLEHEKLYSDARGKIEKLWLNETDADIALTEKYPWLKVYQKAGRRALDNYLGGYDEIDFDEINGIIKQFKEGKSAIMLKRMGRVMEDLWYDMVDFTDVDVMIIEWTHSNNPNLSGVDVPILLNSTPEETLAHRIARNRDRNLDSPFTTMVLNIEQEKLKARADTAAIIVTKDAEIISYEKYLKIMGGETMGMGPMLNAYPNSVGGMLGGMLDILQEDELKNCFESFYVLPSIYNTDLDRGFSVIDYNINKTLSSEGDLQRLQDMGINLKLDFILNHASVLSAEFQDIIKNGWKSKYTDFFIDWNKFWDGCGKKDEDGVIVPDDKYIKDMFFRKPGLPVLNVRMPSGEQAPFWNTFYQEVKYPSLDAQDIMSCAGVQYEAAKSIAELVNTAVAGGAKPNEIDFGDFAEHKANVADMLESRRKYLGQMDLNVNSPLVWEFYEQTLDKLASYGASIVRLDAFAYAAKSPGRHNFFNEPETWDILSRIKALAEKRGLKLLPEIHSSYKEGMHTKIARKGYMAYDFFLPGLLIDAIERKTARVIKRWIDEIIENDIKCVNMLGCHDGIPLLDLKGLLSDKEIQSLIDIVVSRGGYVKDLHGKKNIYYQVNATYFSALGEDEKRMALARAVQMFMPGKPQVWYLDLFAGTNDHEAVKRAGVGGHKEINRTNLTSEQALEILSKDIVKNQAELIALRNTHPAFKNNAEVTAELVSDSVIKIAWQNKTHKIELTADFAAAEYKINEP